MYCVYVTGRRKAWLFKRFHTAQLNTNWDVAVIGITQRVRDKSVYLPQESAALSASFPNSIGNLARRYFSHFAKHSALSLATKVREHSAPRRVSWSSF